jgi:hypothetical protein
LNEYNFNKSNKIGTEGVNEILKFLDKDKSILGVVSVEDNKIYQPKGIDFIAVTKTEKLRKIEIKTDTYDTGNYFIETISNSSKNTKGCLLTTESDFIFYYFIKKKELNIINTKKFQEWFDLNQNRFSSRTCCTGVNGSSYSTIGKLVPIKILNEELDVKTKDISKFIY